MDESQRRLPRSPTVQRYPTDTEQSSAKFELKHLAHPSVLSLQCESGRALEYAARIRDTGGPIHVRLIYQGSLESKNAQRDSSLFQGYAEEKLSVSFAVGRRNDVRSRFGYRCIEYRHMAAASVQRPQRIPTTSTTPLPVRCHTTQNTNPFLSRSTTRRPTSPGPFLLPLPADRPTRPSPRR